MRVLFVNLNQSPAFGGVERWMMDAAAGLASRGHACVMLGRPAAPWMEAARASGLRVREDHRGPWAERVLRVRAAMRAERPDLVVVKAKKAARMAAWGRATGGGGRVVLFLGATHELDARRWIDRYTWRSVDAALVVAHAAARWYRDQGFGPADKLHVLWKGVDLGRWQTDAAARTPMRAALGLGADDLAIGTVGRLAWQKGLEDLFAAARLVRDRVPGARFFVVGGGQREAARIAAAAAAPELGGAVELLGQRDDVPALLAAMDIVVQPSRREAMAQTTLEAMAAARPVVSTTTVGADEAIEDGVSGMLVPVAEPGALADAIVTLAGDPMRRAALAAAARRRVAEYFTMERMVERCEAIFVALGAGGGARTDLSGSGRSAPPSPRAGRA